MDVSVHRLSRAEKSLQLVANVSMAKEWKKVYEGLSKNLKNAHGSEFERARGSAGCDFSKKRSRSRRRRKR